MSEWIDDGYPTSSALERIKCWEIASQSDLDALWHFVRELWAYPERFTPYSLGDEAGEIRWLLMDADWSVSTGGWSGNEDIIDALQRNYLFWSLCWKLHRSGGHYWFQISGVVR